MNWTLVVKNLRDRWKSAVAWAAGMMALTSIQLYIYPSVAKSSSAMDEFIKVFPKEMIAMFRITDYTSSAGFLGTELFSMMLPLVFISVGASWGAAAGAEEEERGTSEVIYALPIRRSTVIFSKLFSTWIVLAAIGGLEYLALNIGARLVDLDLKGLDLAAGIVACVALGVFFNGISLAIATATGKRGIALGASIGLALLSFLIFSLAPMVDSFDAILPAMPFEWALGKNPLKDGFDWAGLGWLGLGGIVAYAFGLFIINRRDLDA